MSFVVGCCRNSNLLPPPIPIHISSSSSSPNPNTCSLSSFFFSSPQSNIIPHQFGQVPFSEEHSHHQQFSCNQQEEHEEHEEHEEDEENEEDEEDEDGAERWPCLISIEESLPKKRGLSNHYSGRSKSFADLSEAKTVSDLVKLDNPLNKKRRTLLAWKWRSSFSS